MSVTGPTSPSHFDKGQTVTAGHLPVGPAHKNRVQPITGTVTHTGLSHAVAEVVARNDGASMLGIPGSALGAHSAIHKDSDGTYSVIRIDTHNTPALKRKEFMGVVPMGIAGAIIASTDVAVTLRNSAKAAPDFTFID